MTGGVQQQPTHARILHSCGALPAREREPAYTRVELRVPRISMITNFDHNEESAATTDSKNRFGALSDFMNDPNILTGLLANPTLRAARL